MERDLPCPVRLLAAAALLFFVSSCSVAPVKTYTGPDLPPEKTAVLESYSGTTIVACDGQEYSRSPGRLVLLPGTHAIAVSFSGFNSNWLWDSASNFLFIEFTAEGGRTYWVRSDFIDGVWLAYVSDKKTGEKIKVRYVTPSWGLPLFERTTRLNPSSAYAWQMKGDALFDLKKYDEALYAVGKAIELKPDYINAWNTRGRALLSMKQYDDALKAFERTAELAPDKAFAWYNKGLALQHLKRYDDALSAYDKCIQFEPDHVGAWGQKAAVLRSLGRENEATHCLDTARELKSKEQKK